MLAAKKMFLNEREIRRLSFVSSCLVIKIRSMGPLKNHHGVATDSLY